MWITSSCVQSSYFGKQTVDAQSLSETQTDGDTNAMFRSLILGWGVAAARSTITHWLSWRIHLRSPPNASDRTETTHTLSCSTCDLGMRSKGAPGSTHASIVHTDRRTMASKLSADVDNLSVYVFPTIPEKNEDRIVSPWSRFPDMSTRAKHPDLTAVRMTRPTVPPKAPIGTSPGEEVAQHACTI